jgi:hypothetical protein
MLVFVSCDETSKPSSSYLIEKTISNSSEEQVVQSGDNFKIVFPANSISGNLEIKVKKETSPPAMSIQNTKLGKNCFKIGFKSDSDILKPIIVSINYDASQIPTGKEPADIVKAYLFASGSWKLADYYVDKDEKKIYISIESLINPKSYKDEPVLLEENGEIIIGDAYTTTDTGQDDEFLAKLQKSKYISVEFAGYHSGLKNGEWSEIRFPLYFNLASEEFTDNLTWTGNQFSATLESGGWISGSFNTKTKTINLQAYADQTKSWSEASGYDTVNIESNITFENIPYDYDWLGMFYKFGLDGGGNEVKAMVKQVIYIKTTKNINGTKTEEYKSTDYSKNARIEILFMHY